MIRRLRFRPKNKIRKKYKGKLRVVFYPGTEYHGELFKDGSIVATSNKCDGSFVIGKKEVTIIEFL